MNFSDSVHCMYTVCVKERGQCNVYSNHLSYQLVLSLLNVPRHTVYMLQTSLNTCRLIHPQNRNGDPIINPNGKYLVSFNLNGCRRKVRELHVLVYYRPCRSWSLVVHVHHSYIVIVWTCVHTELYDLLPCVYMHSRGKLSTIFLSCLASSRSKHTYSGCVDLVKKWDSQQAK